MTQDSLRSEIGSSSTIGLSPTRCARLQPLGAQKMVNT